MKKVVSMLLAVVMAFSLCACGNTAKENGKETVAANATEQTKETVKESSSEKESAVEEDDSLYPIVDEPITVKAVVVGQDTEVRKDRLVWNKVSEITGINIEWEVIDKEAFPTYLASGELPDFIHHNLSKSQINDYGVIGGKFVNYYDYLDLMPNLVKTFEDYPMIKKAATHANGEMYGLPGVEVAATSTACRPYVRTDVLEANGLEMPKTIDEFYNVLVTLKEKNGEAGFIYQPAGDESCWGPFIYAAFGPLTNMNFDDDGTGKVIFNRTSDQMKLYYEFMHKLYAEGLLHQEYITMEVNARREMAKSGKWVFMGNELQRLTTEDFADGQFHVSCPAPFTSEYDSTQEILGKSVYIQGSGFYINKESEYIEELCRMFDIMYATEEVVEGSGLYGMSFCYGLEGEHWEFVSDSTYRFLAPESYNGDSGSFQIKEVVWSNAGRLDALAGYVSEGMTNSTARQIAFVENIIPYQSEVYFPVNLLNFTDDEQYTLDNKLTDIKAYYKEMEGKFITGVLDIESEWDTYCKTLEEMGVQDVIDVYQAAYDRFNAAE